MTLTQAPPNLRLEPSPRWVRGILQGEPIVDSKRVMVAYGLRRLPLYLFPREDARMDRLQPGRSEGELTYYNAQAGDRTVEDIAWTWDKPSPEHEALRGYVAFEWRKIDSWFEEDDEVFVHPRDPYHRVDVLNSSRHIRVVIDGQVVADTHRPRLLFETGLRTRYYIPKVDVRMDLLEPSHTSTACPYKGNAVYWSVRIGDKLYEDVVWGYPFPVPECPKIQNLVAFYNEKVDIYIDGQLEEKPPRR